MITLHQFEKVSNTHYLERKFLINLSTTMRNFQLNARMMLKKGLHDALHSLKYESNTHTIIIH
jgi:hypothetical protein